MGKLAIVSLFLAVSGSAAAQNYVGVVPGSDVLPENLAAAPGEGALVTWPGFQMMPEEIGGSRVFVQTSVEVAPELKREGDNWVVLLSGVGLPPGNARRPLDTHYFNTPVRSVRTVARGSAVGVVLEMRAKLKPILRTERAQNGYFFTYIEFPPGDFLSGQSRS